jgi:hypothetical protein
MALPNADCLSERSYLFFMLSGKLFRIVPGFPFRWSYLTKTDELPRRRHCGFFASMSFRTSPSTFSHVA